MKTTRQTYGAAMAGDRIANQAENRTMENFIIKDLNLFSQIVLKQRQYSRNEHTLSDQHY